MGLESFREIFFFVRKNISLKEIPLPKNSEVLRLPSSFLGLQVLCDGFTLVPEVSRFAEKKRLTPLPPC